MNTELMDIVVNGVEKCVPAQMTVSELLQQLRIPEDRVAIELNKAIIRKRDWSSTAVSNGSQIEIVQFVGGG